MVSTRKHPSSFSESGQTSADQQARSTRSSRLGSWSHTPDRLTLAWLLVSLPLVIWDTVYVLGRPHTMPDGWLNKPMYVPYSLYGTIDTIYGWEAWLENDGFTGAQSAMNIVETIGYISYLTILWRYGEGEGFGRKTLAGAWGGLACLIGFGLAIMTVSKTSLYGLNEAFSGFRHVRHNDAMTIVTAYIFPNGCWIALPSYMAYAFGRDILDGLAIASGDTDHKLAKVASLAKEE